MTAAEGPAAPAVVGEESEWSGLDPYIRPDLAHAALVTIDVQVDFLTGGASPLPGTDEVLPAITRLVAAFRSAGRPIIHVVRLYQPDDVDLVRRRAIESGQPIVRPGSPGAALAPGLAPRGAAALDAPRLLGGEVQPLGADEVVLWKPRWSAFHRTPLQDHLEARGVGTIVVAGLNYPNCPRATISDASARDYRIVVVSDALSGLVGLHLEEAAAIGAVPARSDVVTRALEHERR